MVLGLEVNKSSMTISYTFGLKTAWQAGQTWEEPGTTIPEVNDSWKYLGSCSPHFGSVKNWYLTVGLSSLPMKFRSFWGSMVSDTDFLQWVTPTPTRELRPVLNLSNDFSEITLVSEALWMTTPLQRPYFSIGILANVLHMNTPLLILFTCNNNISI